MLDYFAIFTKGGALLWTLQFTAALKHNPVDALNALIRTCLLEERSGEVAFTFAPKAGAQQALKWTFHNGLGLVFVAVYQRALSLLYVDDLLAQVKDAFTTGVYKPGYYEYANFNDKFTCLLRDCEAAADAARRGATAAAAVQAPPQPQKQDGRARGGAKGGSKRAGGAADAGKSDGEGDAENAAENGATPLTGSSFGSDDGASDSAAAAPASAAFDVSKLKAGSRKLGGGPKAAARSRRGGTADSHDDKGRSERTPERKRDRQWDRPGSVSKLDYSKGEGGGSAGDLVVVAAAAGTSRMEEEDEYSDEEDEVEDGAVAAAAPGAKASGGAPPARRGVLGAFVSSLAMRVVGKGALTAEDLAPALEDMRRKLMERNVAEEIAGRVCASVAQSLEGQKLSSFTGVSHFVRSAFEGALSGILYKRQVDVLGDIGRQKAKGRPYVIVFCGVNGVGKSTNLAKIAYWLGSHGFSVQLAACDTFRAGAVEQLKTHAMRLGVPLYDRGYEKDPAKVAAEAVRVAERDGRDVVLVDTAGRMQDNEPLMRALANLIHVNTPNLVLFVGEALVGNDAVDQLVKFNRALLDLAPPGSAKRSSIIDGIVLTKFDTIDDKVGAALSMVYTSGAPVMFVGCGQTYVDLKRLNVKSVVKALLK